MTGLAFAAAPALKALTSRLRRNSPDHNAKGTQSVVPAGEPVGQPPTACRHVVSGALSLPARGCFSPVPHGTRPLSVTRESSALEGGPPGFAPGLSCRALLRNSATPGPWPSPTGLSPPLAPRSRGLPLPSPCASVGPTTPRPRGPRFGLRPVRSPLLGASRLISLPPGTEMFQFPGFALRRSGVTGVAAGRVSPFGHPGIAGCVPLPPAYRSLPRPSSPPCAQASPTCLRSLDSYSSSRARAIY